MAMMSDTFPDLHHKMSKKIAQLTKVIYTLNTKNDDQEMLLNGLNDAYEEEINAMLQVSRRPREGSMCVCACVPRLCVERGSHRLTPAAQPRATAGDGRTCELLPQTAGPQAAAD